MLCKLLLGPPFLQNLRPHHKSCQRSLSTQARGEYVDGCQQNRRGLLWKGAKATPAYESMTRARSP